MLTLHLACDIPCAYDYDPVCGDDGVQYDNKCLFKIAKCKKKAMSVAYTGECKKGKYLY